MADTKIESDVAGVIWKVLVSEGDRVEEGAPVVIIESMKMEVPVVASDAGVVARVFVKEGDTVKEGATIVLIVT